MRHRFRSLLVVATGVMALLLAVAPDARAVSITVTPSPLSGAPGSDVDLFYALGNDTWPEAITLVSATPQWPAGAVEFGMLDTFWGDAFDVLVAPGANVSGTIGTFTFFPDAAGGTALDLVFLFSRNPDDVFTTLVTVPLEARVPSVPEPASLTLLGAALAGLGVGVWRRRRETRAAPDA